MNITDFKDTDYKEGLHVTGAVFHRQHELMEKYHPIEIKNGLLKEDLVFPLDIDDKFAQARIKDFCWRTTEELMEAFEVVGIDTLHVQEELIDALHFLTELCIQIGLLFDEDIISNTIKEMQARKDINGIVSGVLETVLSLGLAANCLKNKPWKQTHVLTDKNKFYNYITEAYVNLIKSIYCSGLKNPRMVYEVYFKKSEVNKFRQRSNY